MPIDVAMISRLPSLTATVRAVRAGALGAEVHQGDDPAVLDAIEDPVAVFCDSAWLAEVLKRCGTRQPRVFVLAKAVDHLLLAACVEDHRVTGVIGIGDDDEAERPWELTYAVRRVVAPAEDPPNLAHLLEWGATTLTWTPRTTDDLRLIVRQVELLCTRLGVLRWQAASVSTAAHELLMNAMYDAPVHADGRPRYAMDRTVDVVLEDVEVPTAVFTITGDSIGLDVVDRAGRLPRRRFFQAILRGQRNSQLGGVELDRSHGGAGLGLHTLFHAGAVLRAEVLPGERTHVSWVLDRRTSRQDHRAMSRSLFFVARVSRDVLELRAGDLQPL